MKSFIIVKIVYAHKSLPSRGAWIEIVPARMATPAAIVAPLAGSVD